MGTMCLILQLRQFQTFRLGFGLGLKIERVRVRVRVGVTISNLRLVFGGVFLNNFFFSC
jgi:hypothetical protein